MRAKIILIIGMLLLITLTASAQETEETYLRGYHCYDDSDIDEEDCTYVVGQVYTLEAIPDGGTVMHFPDDPLPRKLIYCTDETAVTLAKYEGGNWVQIRGAAVLQEEGGIIIEAFIGQDTFPELPVKIAVIRNMEALGFEGDKCVGSGCKLNIGPFIIKPHNMYVDETGNPSPYVLENEDAVELNFCGMTPGCRVEDDGVCNPFEEHCLKGVAITCDQTCTNEDDRCCNPAQDTVCDPDCEPGGGEDFYSPDEDCRFKDADALEGLEPETLFDEPFIAPLSSVGWKEYEIGEETFENGKIVNGPVIFQVGKGDNDVYPLWFKDFQYQDFNNKWRLLFPAKQSPNGHTLQAFSSGWPSARSINWGDLQTYLQDNKYKFPERISEETLGSGEKGEYTRGLTTEEEALSVGGFGGAAASAETYVLVGGYLGPVGALIGAIFAFLDLGGVFATTEEGTSDFLSAVFWAHPALWMQSYEDGGAESEGVEQFWFVNTPIKKIKFKARHAGLSGRSCSTDDTKVWCAGHSDGIKDFTVSITGYKTDFDPDADGASSGVDCHDNDPGIHPGAQEICDGIDNDCDSYTWDPDPAKATRSDTFSLYSELDTMTRNVFVSDSQIMPCDGFIRITSAQSSPYIEVKRIDTPDILEDILSYDLQDIYENYPYYAAPDFLYQIKEPLYSQEIFDLPGYFGFDPSLFANNSQQIADFFKYGAEAHLPGNTQERHQPLYAGFSYIGASRGVIGINANDQIIAAGHQNEGERSGGCKIGMPGSCTCPFVPLIFDVTTLVCPAEEVHRTYDDADDKKLIYYIDPIPYGTEIKAWQRNATGYEDTFWADYTWRKTDINEHRAQGTVLSIPETEGIDGKGGIELRKGDLIKYYVSEGGGIEGEIYCYATLTDIEERKKYIDEVGCAPEKIEVHVCKGEFFPQEAARRCQEDLCAKQEVDRTQVQYAQDAAAITANCQLSISQEYSEGDFIEFHAWLCPKDEDCYNFYNGNFKICGTAEICGDTRDNDCDGLTDRDDPDCEGKCYEGECDITQGKWCVNSQWVSESYCTNCGHADSSCQKTCDPSVTEEEFQSCEEGCLEGACDTAANKLGTKTTRGLVCAAGTWTDTGYDAKCKEKDADYSACEEATCDTQQNVTCTGKKWESGGYCLTGCGKKDESCYADRKDKYNEEPYCQEGSYDIYANKWCNENHEWTSQNYCQRYGALDSDCGPKACTEMVTLPDGTEMKNCDYKHQKYCKNGKWTSEGYCSLQNCGADIKSRTTGGDWGTCSQCEETGPEEGATCMDGMDNDCDGYVDCDDSDCPDDLEGCSCDAGEEKTCHSDPLNSLGLCAAEPGTQTCTNSAWGSCEDAFVPQMETCNGFDDDCDGSTDEGCGDCQTGETRNCGVDRGACSAGVQECDDTGHWTICFGAGYKKAEPETCDSRDNDCDEEVDEGCGCSEGQNQTCGEDAGECEPGQQQCIGGTWGACLGGKSKISETGSQCSDGKDNDCDSKTDSDDENCQATSTLKPVCYDAEQNQDEEETDCGGDSCPPCGEVTCNDRQKNGDEEGIDCGGTRDCPQCRGRAATETGAQPKEEQPEEATEGEIIPEEAEGGFPWLYIIGGVVLLGAVLFLLYNKFGKPPAAKQQQTAQAKTMTKLAPQYTQQKPVKQRITKSREEEALEKSIEESKGIFKK